MQEWRNRGSGGRWSLRGSARGRFAIERSEAIARTLDGFRDGRAEDVSTVRAWIGAVVRGGSWRFADSEGITQEVLMGLVRIVRAGRVKDPGSFQKLTYTVAKNVCVDAYHSQRRRQQIEGAEQEPTDEPAQPEPQGPHADLERVEKDRILRYVLQRLPQGCRDLLAWVYGEGADATQAAERLGIQPGAARVRIHRCLKRAREIYRDRSGAVVSPGEA